EDSYTCNLSYPIKVESYFEGKFHDKYNQEILNTISNKTSLQEEIVKFIFKELDIFEKIVIHVI
ncbi:hypothetical protein, partial [Cronobacter sakazakii]|uniref:hypothetical protein n=1 Tax=Cronobacter sakazakii TaxID=28141 RepID=UPI001F3BE540